MTSAPGIAIPAFEAVALLFLLAGIAIQFLVPKGPSLIGFMILTLMMSRLCIHLAGFPLYRARCSHNRDAYFFNEECFRAYCHSINEAIKETVMLFMLMANKVYLLLIPSQVSISLESCFFGQKHER
jgi:hypothetical protein